jgi:uroporphyrinogen-III synthase
MRSVLVTRPQPAAAEFAEKLRHAGFNAYVAPLMEYAEVAAEIPDLSACQALVFTSMQGVQGFTKRSAQRDLPVLAVGDATAAAATAAGFANVYSAKGDSSDVANLIRAEAKPLGLKKILHVCSEDTADSISAGTSALGVEVVRLPVYKALHVDHLTEEAANAIKRGLIDGVTLFSARTAANFVRILKKDFPNSSPRLEVVCISERVAEKLKGLPWRCIHVAHRPTIESVMDVLRNQKNPTSEHSERRHGPDRRAQAPKRDLHGHIQSHEYIGPDRRRQHQRRQHDKILKEKIRFLNRSMLTAAFMFFSIVSVGVFLMAPEYAQLEKKPQWLNNAEDWLRHLKMPDHIQGLLSRSIEHVEVAAAPAVDAAGQIADGTVEAFKNPATGLPALTQMLGTVTRLRESSSGQAAVERSMDTLRQLLAGSADKPENFNGSVEEARKKDPTLDALLGPVKGQDLAAGAMLLVLNEFRSNVSNSRPYAQDLATLQKFAGNDPKMNQALQKLAPYAAGGVMNRKALQAELKGLAGDIVMAKLHGQDVSVQEQARKRFERLSQAQNAGDISGAGSDAVVARAQLLLDQGDVRGAMRELQSLDGQAAAAAQPWMQNAAGNVTAEDSSNDLVNGMLGGVTGGDSGYSVSDLAGVIKSTLSGGNVPYISPALTKGGDGGAGVVAPR